MQDKNGYNIFLSSKETLISGMPKDGGTQKKQQQQQQKQNEVSICRYNFIIFKEFSPFFIHCVHRLQFDLLNHHGSFVRFPLRLLRHKILH